MTAVLVSLLAASSAVAGVQGLTEREQALTLCSEAVRLFYAGEIETARRLLIRADEISPNTFEIPFWLARTHAVVAGSSEQDRRKAIEYLTRCLRIEGDGENAEVATAWLIKLGGRPKRIAFTVAGVEASSGRPVDSLLSGQVLELAIGFARRDKYEAIDQTNETWELRALDEKVAALRTDTGLDIGWLVLVSAEPIRTEEVRNGKWIAHSNARMWVYDCLTRRLLPEIRLPGLNALDVLDAVFGSSSSSDAYDTAVDTLADSLWLKVRRVTANYSRATILDEIFIPTNVPGVYARWTGSFSEGKDRPIVGFMTRPSSESVESLDLQRLNDALLTSFLMGKKYAVVTPAYAMRLVASVKSEGQIGVEEFVAGAQRLDAAYFGVVDVLSERVSLQNNLGINRIVRFSIRANVVVVDCKSGKRLAEREVDAFASKQTWFEGDPLDRVVQLRDEAYGKLAQAICRLVQ